MQTKMRVPAAKVGYKGSWMIYLKVAVGDLGGASNDTNEASFESLANFDRWHQRMDC
jgi:hypothetical protein